MENSFLHFWGNKPESEEAYHCYVQGIRGTKSNYTSPRGLSVFSRSWPPNTPPRGVICMVQDQGNDMSWSLQSTPIFLARMGFACFALDLDGHGLEAFIPNLDLVAHDCSCFFNSIKQNPEFERLPLFLYGESVGGAICLLIHFFDPDAWSGAILVAPMCKISDKVKPTSDLLDKSVKVEEKKVKELLRFTQYLNSRLGDVGLPFIVLHGSADAVTDPSVSEHLYQEAKSQDKTIKIYDGMMHSLLLGETDENIEIVRNDILSWLNNKCDQGWISRYWSMICSGVLKLR